MFLFLLFLTVGLNEVNSADHGVLCSERNCYLKKGYIDYPKGSKIDQWTLHSSTQGHFETFVLIIKNIKKNDLQFAKSYGNWLTIIQQSYVYRQTHQLDNTEERLLVFKDTNEVTIQLNNYGVSSFEINFYVGCGVFEKNNAKISRKSKATTNINTVQFFGIQRKSTPECWIVMPLMHKITPFEYWQSTWSARTSVQLPPVVEQTYLSFQNVTMGNNDTLHVANLLTGSPILSLNGNEKLKIEIVKKSNTTFTYDHNKVSTMLLIELNCDSDQECQNAHFAMTVNALTQKDVNCLEKEMKCQYNIGNKDFNCSEPIFLQRLTNSAKLSNYNCAAINSIISNVQYALDSAATENNETIAQRNLSITQENSIEKAFRECPNIPKYCSVRKCKTRKIKRKCHGVCFFVKYKAKLCVWYYGIF